MKALTYCILGAAVLSLAACGHREIDIAPPELVQGQESVVHFTTGTIETRTAFGESYEKDGKTLYPTYWTANDHAVSISMNYEQAVTAGVNSDETDENGHITRASFDASFAGIEATAPYKFYLVSPASAFVWPSANREAVSVFIPGRQKPTPGSIDEAAQIIVAVSDEYASMPTGSVEVDFNHLTAYGKLTLTNVNPGEGVTVESVTLWSEEQPLAGSWYYKFADKSVESKEPSSSLVLDAANLDIPGGDPVWFACAAAAMGGKPLKISVNLSNGKALVRTISLRNDFVFASGKITKFSVNMASAELVDQGVELMFDEFVYRQVTSFDQLAVGDELVFVDSADPMHIMLSTTNYPGFRAGLRDDAFTFGDGVIRIPEGSKALSLTIIEMTGSTIKLQQTGSDKHLITAILSDGETAYLSLYNWNGGAKPYTLVFSSGEVTMTPESNTSFYLRYDASYNRFALLKEAGTVAIFKKGSLTSSKAFDMETAPVLSFSEYGAYLKEQNLVYNSATDQISREYSSDGTLTFAVIGPAEAQLLEFSGIPSNATVGDTFLLGLTYMSDPGTKQEGTYDVGVVQENGPMLWLSDALGNGFIVKR